MTRPHPSNLSQPWNVSRIGDLWRAFSPTWRLLLLLFLPGLCIAMWRCGLRISIEEQDRFVETVMDFEELREIARNEGWSLPEVLEAVASSGASSIGISEDTLNSLEAEGRISVLGLPDLQRMAINGGIASFPPMTGIGAGALWIHSRDPFLLNRIEYHTKMKLFSDRVERLQSNVLLIRKTGEDLRSRFGLGFSTEWIALAQSKNLGVVLRIHNYPGLSYDSIRHILEGLPDPEQVSALIFAEEEVLGNRGNMDATVTGLLMRPFRLGWVEFNDQAGMDRLLAGLNRRITVVKVHSIGRRELDENYNVERATARLIRAVRDRRLKLLYVRCFLQDKKKLIGDLVLFNLRYLSGIASQLEKAGFGIPRTNVERRSEPRYDMPPISSVGRFGMGLALLMGFPCLIAVSRRRPLGSTVVWMCAGLVVPGFIFLSPDVFAGLAGLVGAVSFSTIGCLWAIAALEKRLEDPEHAFSGLPFLGCLTEGTAFLARLVLPGLLGGILVAGIHSEQIYLLKFQQFRGIKLAFMLPLVWVGIWSLQRYGGAILAYFSRPITFRDLFIGLAVCGGVALYLLRSGNLTLLKPSETEDVFRTFLENLLMARPRNKEFLIGYPAVFLFLFCRFRKLTSILPVLALFVEMGQVSMLNTFCHFHSPLILAFVRGFNGLWVGLLVGTAALSVYVACRVLAAAGQKEKAGMLIGYFGFGNLGDELLWRRFVAEADRKHPDWTWYLLNRTPGVIALPSNVKSLSRTSVLEVVETLAAMQILVVPGGGVLQAVTSRGSLMYYLGLMAIGKLFGARMLLPCQGLGPWQMKHEASVSQFPADVRILAVTEATRLILEFADYLSVRDASSILHLTELSGPTLKAELSGDLLFAGAEPPTDQSGQIRAGNGLFRIGVILRGSVAASAAITGKLLEWGSRNPGVQLVPLAFQPEEDEKPWEAHGEVKRQLRVVEAWNVREPLENIDLLISMRLHGCILATLFGIPWIGLSYDPKVAGFAGEIGWSFVMDPDRFAIEEFDKLVAAIRDNPRSQREKLFQAMSGQREKVQADLEKCLTW